MTILEDLKAGAKVARCNTNALANFTYWRVYPVEREEKSEHYRLNLLHIRNDLGEIVKIHPSSQHFDIGTVLQDNPKMGTGKSTPKAKAPKATDAVNSPSHYAFFDGIEAIDIIARSMTVAEFRGYCLGNRLKYRLRAGNKDKLEQDIAKSDKYLELFDKFKGLCHDAT